MPVTADPALFAESVALGVQVIWLHTYGGAYAGPDRPEGDVRYPRGDARQPLALTPVTTMPTGVTYDEDRARVVLGDGEFGPVGPEVWEYAVGGKNVVRSWVNYRKAEPGGKKSSPLDHVRTGVWDPGWTTELIDLLTVLTRLVALEPAQADLLARVVAGPVVTKEALRGVKVRWPTTLADRKPRYTVSGLTSQDQDTLDL